MNSVRIFGPICSKNAKLLQRTNTLSQRSNFLVYSRANSYESRRKISTHVRKNINKMVDRYETFLRENAPAWFYRMHLTISRGEAKLYYIRIFENYYHLVRFLKIASFNQFKAAKKRSTISNYSRRQVAICT